MFAEPGEGLCVAVEAVGAKLERRINGCGGEAEPAPAGLGGRRRGSCDGVESAGIAPDLGAESGTVEGSERGAGNALELGDGGNAAAAQIASVDAIESVKSLDRKVRQEVRFGAGRDDAKVSGKFHARRGGGSDSGSSGADADAEAGEFEDFELQAAEGAGEVLLKERGSEKI